MDFSAVTPGLVITIYVVVELVKHLWLKDDNQRSMLPIICIAVGAVIGILLFKYYPEGIDVDNYVDAIASGGLSGIAATGCNQLWIQFKKYSQGYASIPTSVTTTYMNVETGTTNTVVTGGSNEITNTDIAEDEIIKSPIPDESQAVG